MRNGIEIAVYGMRGLTKIAINTTQQVVGKQTIIRRAMTVVIISELFGDGICGKVYEGFILRLSLQKVKAHTQALGPVGFLNPEAVEPLEGRVRMILHQRIYLREHSIVSTRISTPHRQTGD